MEELVIRTAGHFASKPDFDSEFDLKTVMAECDYQGIYELMIDFAKYHVQAALGKASEKSYVEYIDLQTGETFDYTDVITDDNVGADVNIESILNAYPLSNIQ